MFRRVQRRARAIACLVCQSLGIVSVVFCMRRLKEDKSWFESFQFGKVKQAPSQSDYIILESTLSSVKTDELTCFWYADIDPKNVKGDL